MINDNRQAQPGLRKGTKLGPYEILAPIGVGGMGEVYKAKDTRLDRTVAIKVLPSHLAENLDLKQRFEREARAVSSLNHPHICTLYEFDTHDGTDFLVMEYIEGETLAEKLTKGALPIDKALEYAIQIADGLDKAHRAGIVHRDLKPGNIMLTKLGIKILDFGLAKLQPEVAESEDSEEPTRQKPLTDAGSILGTVQYMAPEQLEGKEADARTDLFAFGTVVYEMVTGRRAFEGKSQASLIAAIMEHEPFPLTEIQPLSPPTLERAVKKCLAKDPQDRWFSAHDLRDDLKWISERGAEEAAAIPAATSPKFWRRYGVAAAMALLLAGLAGWQLKPAPPPGPVTRFAMTLPPTQQLTSTGQTAVALSPDGTQLVYVANNRLYLRSMDQMESNPMQGTDMPSQEARSPIFSPDGQWVAFSIDGKLKKILVRGGAPVILCDLPGPWVTGASWDFEDAIVFADAEKGILRVSADGGVPEVLIPRDPAGALYFRNPQILPGGKSVLFTMASRDTRKEAQTVIQTLATGERRVLLEEGDNARYVPPGHLIYALGETLLAIPFDLESLQVTGGGVPIIENVLRDRFNSAANFNFSNSGSLVYIPASALLEKETLAWIDREGFAVPAMAELSEAFFPDPYTPRFSPDGRQLAVNHAFEDIWVYDLSRGTRIRLTDEGMNIRPIWSPDGSLIAFSTSRRGKLSLFAKPADGSGETKALSTSGAFISPNSWSADGRLLAFYDLQGDIGVLSVDGQQEPQTVIATTFFEHSPVFSPDGRWLAYVSNESGQDEIYIQAYPGPGGKWSISTGRGQEPLWSSDGRELYYRNGDQVKVVTINTGDGIAIGKPRLLFEAPLSTGTRGRYFYDVSPDGSMFVIVKRADESRPAEIHVVLNWFEKLKRLVPND